MHYVSSDSKTPSTPGKFNFYLVRSIIVGALGGLLFGFDTAVIAGTTHQLTQVFNLSPSQLGFTVSIALWGTVIGAMFSGILGDKLGGRESLRILAAFYVISALGCAVAWNWYALLFFRLSADWASADPQCSDRCTSPRSRPPDGADCWWVRFRSMSWSAFSSPTCRITSSAVSISASTNGAGC